MTRSTLAALGAAAFLAAASAGCLPRGETAASASPGRDDGCDRACLEGFIDRYLTALASHDPSSLPVSSRVKFIENNEVLGLGEGTWQTVSGLGTYRHYFADPSTGQVAAITVVEEKGTKIIYDLRLKIEAGKIAEIEGLAVRDPNGAKLYEQMGKPLPVFLSAVPPAERASREDLIKVANRYFSGMERNDPKADYSFFADDCNRLEHARQTTNMKGEAYGHSSDTEFVTMTCRQQFQTGFLGFVTRIRDRRYVVIDEERQSIFAFAFLDHNGTVRTINLSTGKVFTVPPYFSVPRTLEVGEAWRIEKGKLRQIEMTLSEFPYGKRPQFATGDDWLDRNPREAAPETPRAAARAPCDRGCLRQTVDHFLKALVAHDRTLLRTAPTVRYTENGQRLGLSDGLWATVTALGAYNVYLANPATGEAGYFGAITEHDTPGMLSARLRVEDGAVTEIEAVVVRQETVGERGGTLTLFAPRLPRAFDPARFGKTAPAVPILPASERSAAAAMATAVHRYVGPMERDAGTIRYQRALVADEERGLLLNLMFFDSPSAGAAVDVPTIGVVSMPSATTGPFTVMVSSVYRIVNGKAVEMATVARPMPYSIRSGWE